MNRHEILKAKLARLRDRVPAPGAPSAARASPLARTLPCVHEGDVVEPCRTCAGEARHVRECDRHGRCTRTDAGKGVAVCATCGDYAPDPALLPVRPGWLTIPQPPALHLTPTRTRALVTVVVGEEAQRCFAASGPLMRRYAARVGADFVVLDWPGNPAWPISAKFALARALDHYERIAYVDADVLLRPRCVDLFAMCAPHEFGFVDELPQARLQPNWGTEARYQRFRADMGFRTVPHLPWYMNTGVMVVPRGHGALLLPPPGPMPTHHCAEQDHTGARLLDSGLPYRLLDRRCNWQNWTDPGFRSAPPDAVLHWSGAGGARVSRADQMRAYAAPYVRPFEPPAGTRHEWEIDRRHLLWVSDELLSGRYRRVLEIGCYRGYSTSAFLHALRVGAVDEVHLCDTNPTPELRAAVASAGPGVTLHTCPSVELLPRDARFDLVLVDGDHRAEVVTEEARLLVAAGVPCVFAHDTAADPHNPDCDGPPLLRDALAAAGYALTEDAEERPGERTHRGMLRAVR
ncbi:MAG TPA: class I SAM-dependent methyltransferase [Gemmata sp.]